MLMLVDDEGVVVVLRVDAALLLLVIAAATFTYFYTRCTILALNCWIYLHAYIAKCTQLCTCVCIYTYMPVSMYLCKYDRGWGLSDWSAVLVIKRATKCLNNVL